MSGSSGPFDNVAVMINVTDYTEDEIDNEISFVLEKVKAGISEKIENPGVGSTKLLARIGRVVKINHEEQYGLQVHLLISPN